MTKDAAEQLSVLHRQLKLTLGALERGSGALQLFLGTLIKLIEWDETHGPLPEHALLVSGARRLIDMQEEILARQEEGRPLTKAQIEELYRALFPEAYEDA